jgi:hypothetical protein
MNRHLARNWVLIALLVGLALLAAALGFFELQFLGFPDGYLSDWDRARRVLLTGLIVTSVFVSAIALFLGSRLASAAAGRNLKIAALLYALFLAAVLIADGYLSSQSGRGG